MKLMTVAPSIVMGSKSVGGQALVLALLVCAPSLMMLHPSPCDQRLSCEIVIDRISRMTVATTQTILKNR